MQLLFDFWVEFLAMCNRFFRITILPILSILVQLIWLLFQLIYLLLSTIKHLLEDYGLLSSKNQSFHELYRNHLNIKNVIQNQTDSFSDEFKDLVIRMISYNYLERPTLEQIEEHPWMQGPVPSKEEVKQAMSWLKSKFIQKEV